MSKENISVKFLIHLVGERPALWDKTSDDYKDRALKETSWREICSFINENYMQMQPKAKTEFTRMIMRKWTHIRDSWVKSMKYGYDEVTKRPPKPYIYHNELKFMQKNLKCKPPRYDFNRPEISNMNFEEFFREKNETQNSNEANGKDEHGDDDQEEEEENDTSVENVKHEPSYNDSDHLVNQHDDVIEEAEDQEDDDDWPLEDNDINNIIEEQSDEEPKVPPAKKKRVSIFKNSRDLEEEFRKNKQIPYEKPRVYEKSKEPEKPKQYEKPVVVERPKPANYVKPSPSTNSSPAPIYPLMNVNNHSKETDNRHWNFFKGILPSLETLDEDHILQFQSGVIVLLQKLRESQKSKPTKPPSTHRERSHSLFRGRGRKRKASNDDDYYWPIQNVEVVEDTNRKNRRSTRHRSDPIAADQATESEYSE